MLEARQISVNFGGVQAVNRVSFEVGSAEVLGLIGPNGSGKTTVMNALTGVVGATGAASVDGRLLKFSRPELSRRLGLMRVFQTPQTFTSLSCIENVLLSSLDRRGHGFGGAWLGRRRLWRAEHERWSIAVAALEMVGLGGRAEESAGLLTYGEQRLLEVARGIAGSPRLLMLDEPSAGLNDAETEALAGLLVQVREGGIALLVIDHKIDFIDRLCDRVVVLELGEVIAEGTPADVWRSSRVMDAYLGASNDA